MINLEYLRNELKEIRDILARLDKEIHNNILGLSRRIFESQTSMTRDVQEVLNLCLKLDNWEMDSQNISRELLKRHITGINLSQSFWTKIIVGLSLLIFLTLIIGLYWIINDPHSSEFVVQKVQEMEQESPRIVETPQTRWYNKKWILFGMGCVCILTIYGLAKISTYGLWDSILPASRKQFDKDSLDLTNKLGEINSDILKARQGAQGRIDDLSDLGDKNKENLRDIQDGLRETPTQDLQEALALLQNRIHSYSHQVEGLEKGASAQSGMISHLTQELVHKGKEKEIPSSNEGMDESGAGLMKGTYLFRHKLRPSNSGSKSTSLDSPGPSGKPADEVPEGSSSSGS